MKLLKKHQTLILLFIILALAFFFRFWQIDAIPPGLYPDEAIHGNNASQALETGDYKVFYPENNGREGLFINLIAFSFRIFGSHVWAIRLVSAIFGFLTVLGLYLFTRELFRVVPRKVLRGFAETPLISSEHQATILALLSTFFLAISFWHINFSRIGFRGIMVPFCLVWSFYFFLGGMSNIPHKKLNILYIILAGFFFGLGFHTYISFRVAVLILILVLILEFIRYWKKNKPEKISWSWLWKKFYLKDGWWKWDMFFLVIIIVALPLGIYFLQNPGSFIGRAGEVSIFKAEFPLRELGLSIAKTLGMFNVYGDGNWRHNFSGRPQLLWPIGILFLIGLVLTIKSWVCTYAPMHRCKISINKNINFFLLTWFLVMLIPGFLSAQAVPHALRAIGVIPVVYIFAALGFYWIVTKIVISLQKHQWNPKRILFTVYSLGFIVLLAITYAQYNKYFNRWAYHCEVQGAFTQQFVDIGQYLNGVDKDFKSFVIVNESGVPVPIKPELTINYYEGKTIPMPAQTIMFITRQKENIKYILPEDIDKIIIKDRKAVIIPMAPDEELFNRLKQKFPQGIRENNVYKI